jgi:hypothetical protein
MYLLLIIVDLYNLLIMSQRVSNEQGQLSVSQISLNVESPDSTMNSTDNTNFSLPSILTKEEYILKICEILELDDWNESKEIAEKSITDGRQALHSYDQDLSLRIFRDEVNAIESELLKLLKVYVEQQWYKSKVCDSRCTKQKQNVQNIFCLKNTLCFTS